MPRIVMIPLIILAVAIVGMLALGIPGTAPAPTAYEKTLALGKQ